MNCPGCGNPVSSRKRLCDSCGCDLSVYRKIYNLSNRYYNRGLEQARVRNLSGAVESLKRSLEMNKQNTVARNLLGLVYFEMGETVAALSEWVISKHFQPNENDADYFMSRVSENPTKLDAMNQAIKKYNLALDSAKQGSDDLAIIQLKKVANLNPRFIRALQLLALLYMKNNDFERANRYLKRAAAIDISNTATLRYMSELKIMSSGEETGSVPYWSDGAAGPLGEDKQKSILPISSYRDDKPNAMVFINLLIGVVIGIVVVYYLIVPTIRSNIREEYNSQKVDYSSELNSKTATITQLEKSVASLEDKLTTAETSLEEYIRDAERAETQTEDYDSLFEAMTAYSTLKNAAEYTDEELNNLALMLWELDDESILNESAVQILSSIRNEIYPLAARQVYREGKTLFDEGNYEEAERLLLAAVDFDPEADSAMYYLAKTYQAAGKYEEAAHYYRLMLEVCPNSTLKQYIPQRLREMGMEE